MQMLAGLLPVHGGNTSMSSQNMTVVDDPYSIRKCQIHPKNMSKN
jgi:hypothetical protein